MGKFPRTPKTKIFGEDLLILFLKRCRLSEMECSRKILLLAAPEGSKEKEDDLHAINLKELVKVGDAYGLFIK